MSKVYLDAVGPDFSALQRCDARRYHCWDTRKGDLADLAEPILASPAFSRLGAITFLGILSPRFADLVHSPLFSRRIRPVPCDGSRYSHCLGVAALALDTARLLGFSEQAQRYAVAWGLLHDIGNWPLSHTGEFSFSKITGYSTRDLRRYIIRGDPRLPANLHLKQQVRESGLEPNTVIAFLDGIDSELPSEIVQLRSLLKSPLSPDALEGMWRAGQVFGVPVVHPREFTSSFLWGIFDDIQLNSRYSKQALQFWRQRRRIFRQYINKRSTVLWESAWSQAVRRCFEGVDVVESLFLSEEAIVSRVVDTCAIKPEPISRYKDPVEYRIYPKRRRVLSDHASLDQLATILTERRATLSRRKLHNVT